MENVHHEHLCLKPSKRNWKNFTFLNLSERINFYSLDLNSHFLKKKIKEKSLTLQSGTCNYIRMPTSFITQGFFLSLLIQSVYLFVFPYPVLKVQVSPHRFIFSIPFLHPLRLPLYFTVAQFYSCGHTSTILLFAMSHDIACISNSMQSSILLSRCI